MAPGSVKVNLHCHSTWSDGLLDPEGLAERLAAAGVRYAALTDHDTVAGLPAFRAALARRGIGWIPGVEITALDDGAPLHLLVYGFDPASPHLRKALERSGSAEDRLPVQKAIEWAHRAGGQVFLAHPLVYGPDRASLKERLARLQGLGLDGLEAIYAPYSQAQILELLELARECGLAVSAGCDYHGPELPGLSDLAIHMPLEAWNAFRETLLSSPGPQPAPRPSPFMKRPLPKLEWRHFLLRILVPTLLAIGLLLVPMFVYVVPGYEQALRARKQETIRELTRSACSILQEYRQDVLAGRMGEAEAKRAAAARLEFLRYGKEGKDYFWITDLGPRMVMHPYRPDLNGQDLANYVDPKGNRVFVEFARLAQEKHEGYFEYVWQWKDDAGRISPKQSYVRLFEPWGWVVGTGLYLEDVQAEIDAITGRIVHVSLALALVIALLLLFIAQQSFRIERKRLVAEEALRISHEKYRALVEASKEGTLLLLEGRCVFVNKTLLDLMGYTEETWALVDLDEAFTLEQGPLSQWVRNLQAPGALLHDAETRMRTRDGRQLRALLTPERIQLGDQDGVILIVRDLRSQRADAERDTLIADLQTSLLFLGEPVSRFMREAPTAPHGLTVTQAASLMNRHDLGALLIQGPSGEPMGLLTDHDLRERVLAQGKGGDRPVYEVMSSPLLSISPTAHGHEALERMGEKRVQYLAVKDEHGAVLGLVRGQDLLRVDHYPLVFLSRSIKEASHAEAMLEQLHRLPLLVKALVDSGAKPRHICRAISAISDTVIEKLVAFAQTELGPPPAAFAFLAMGSEGREEQTLYSDQDTAIVFELPEGASPEEVQAWLLSLGSRVSTWLEAAGHPLCKGDMMARNPRWCQPLPQWKRYFSGWIRQADPRNLMEFNTFFDFRAVHGERVLAAELRAHIKAELPSHPAFFGHLAMDALQYKPPLGFFGKIVTDTDAQGHRTFNVKDAMATIVNFARLYALKHGVAETSTFDRLRRLRELEELSASGYDDLSQAYDVLMTLRLRHQAEQLAAGLPADNDIELKSLTSIEEGLLKQVFTQIGIIQKKISFDYPAA